jgi:hypothetical protein
MEQTPDTSYRPRNIATSRASGIRGRIHLDKPEGAPRFKRTTANLPRMSRKTVVALSVLAVLALLATLLHAFLFPNGADSPSLSVQAGAWMTDFMTWWSSSSPTPASAAASTPTFQCGGAGAPIELLSAWIEGPLSKVLALGMLVTSTGLAVVKNSPMPALTGITSAVFISYGPSILMSLLGTSC